MLVLVFAAVTPPTRSDGGHGMDGPLPQDASETDTGAAILDEALARFGTTEDARLREIMLSLIRHAHAFVRETKLTWDEWERGMAFFATAARVVQEEARHRLGRREVVPVPVHERQGLGHRIGADADHRIGPGYFGS